MEGRFKPLYGLKQNLELFGKYKTLGNNRKLTPLKRRYLKKGEILKVKPFLKKGGALEKRLKQLAQTRYSKAA